MIARARGADLFYTTRGRGPVCLVPSAIGTVPYERQLPAALDAHATLVFVDLRGSGRSTGAPDELTFDVVAEDFEAVREAMGAERVAILGHSMLGALALEYARRRSASVSHVVVAGTPPAGDMAALQARGLAFFEANASSERKRLLQESLAKLPPGATPAQAVMAQTALRFHDATFDAAPLFEGATPRPEVLVRILGSLLPGWDVTVSPASLRAPILIAHGRHDYVVPWVLWETIVETLPAATLRVFERSGHQPFFEEPAEFAAAFAAHLAR
jgi:proline iminopeptidase